MPDDGRKVKIPALSCQRTGGRGAPRRQSQATAGTVPRRPYLRWQNLDIDRGGLVWLLL